MKNRKQTFLEGERIQEKRKQQMLNGITRSQRKDVIFATKQTLQTLHDYIDEGFIREDDLVYVVCARLERMIKFLNS